MSGPRKLDPRIQLVWVAGALVPSAVLGLAALGLALGDIPVGAAAAAGPAVALALLGALWPRARWRSWTYQITDTELIIRFGVVIHVERWLPRTRIQHVDIIGGPLDRALGLRQLVIYTAGTREADVAIPGLPQEVAEELRAELLSWSRPEEATGDDPDPLDPARSE